MKTYILLKEAGSVFLAVFQTEDFDTVKQLAQTLANETHNTIKLVELGFEYSRYYEPQ